MQQHSAPRGDIRFNCPMAARCGGCQLSRLSYREQLALKQRHVEELLGGLCPVEPIMGMDNPLHYRSKVHAVLAVDKRGDAISGVYAQGTHRVVPVKHCLIEDTRADKIIQSIVSMLRPFKLRVYNEYTHRGFLRHVVVRTSATTGQIMVTLVATSLEFPGRKAFIAALLDKHPEITTIVLNLNQRETSMVLGNKETVLYGEGFIEDELCGKRFRLSSRSFYQVNARQTERLYRTAIAMAGLTGGETLLDAYCGTGTIGLCAADGLKRLIGVELNGEAVKDARENARRNGVTNATFHCDDAGRFMVKMAREGHVPDVVMMDPPRAGSDEPFLRSLLTLMPPRIVYVSCNPETLARDAAFLVQGGYVAERAVPVDMFPATSHVETVMCLRKK
ncbi:MAG: 23S rRNA (uracil(1939)-C(5))-methyltransferase RlmD [Aristaeellaceae bacterium]